VLLVADAMTGQDAVQMAERFHQRAGLTGVILTKIDGDARGGAVLSIRAVTQVPLRYLGTGERPDALELFHPDRMASRILGMGDVLSLIERAEETISRDQAEALQKKLRANSFTLEDFRDQIRKIKKMGSLESLVGMLPGGARLQEAIGAEGAAPEGQMARVEAIINSMTPGERNNPSIINGSRRKRIARGSGTTVQEVNGLLKQYLQLRKLMKNLTHTKPGRLNLSNLLRSL
jgi:signal recognition particle subunit SRP54